jgi:hypothetical protein
MTSPPSGYSLIEEAKVRLRESWPLRRNPNGHVRDHFAVGSALAAPVL